MDITSPGQSMLFSSDFTFLLSIWGFNSAGYAACNSLLNNFSRMIFAFSFSTSSPAAARFKVFTLRLVASLHAFTLPCLSRSKVVNRFASSPSNFSYNFLNCTILNYFSVTQFVIENVNECKYRTIIPNSKLL